MVNKKQRTIIAIKNNNKGITKPLKVYKNRTSNIRKTASYLLYYKYLSINKKVSYIKTSKLKYLDLFINDCDYIIRFYICVYGKKEHRKFLLNDKNPLVRAAAEYGHKLPIPLSPHPYR